MDEGFRRLSLVAGIIGLVVVLSFAGLLFLEGGLEGLGILKEVCLQWAGPCVESELQLQPFPLVGWLLGLAGGLLVPLVGVRTAAWVVVGFTAVDEGEKAQEPDESDE